MSTDNLIKCLAHASVVTQRHSQTGIILTEYDSSITYKPQHVLSIQLGGGRLPGATSKGEAALGAINKLTSLLRCILS
jgi:hypothetical protein